MNIEKQTITNVTLYLDNDERQLMKKVVSTILADNLLTSAFNKDDVRLLRWLYEQL